MRAIAFGFQRLCRFAPAELYFVSSSILVDNRPLLAALYSVAAESLSRGKCRFDDGL